MKQPIKTPASPLNFQNFPLQNVQSEFEDRALYLTERRKVFESIYREDTVEASARIHRVSRNKGRISSLVNRNERGYSSPN